MEEVWVEELESSVALFRVPCQPFRLVPPTYDDREGSACALDVCHKRNRIPVLSGVAVPLFIKTCHSYLGDDLHSCHRTGSCSRMEQSPMTVGQFPSKYVREPYDRRSCGGSTAMP